MKKIFPYITLISVLISWSCTDTNVYYQCITDKNNSEALKAYTVQIADAASLSNPGLVILARGIGPGEGFVTVNGTRFSIPPIPGASADTGVDTADVSGKEGWYDSGGSDDLLAKIIIPLPDVKLNNGLNHVVFSATARADGYRISDARLTSVSEKQAKIVQMTYRVVTRGGEPSIDDFDFVVNYKGEGKRQESDLPDWAKRGKVRYYRAGISFDHLDRMFEMFEEGRFNLVMLQVSTPHDTTGEEFRQYKAFIDRCHENGIRVTFDGGASGQPIRLNSISADSVKANPEMEAWLSRDEYGEPRWRRRGSSYWPDLNNQDYRNRVLQTAELGIDAGVDELYYDWAIGGTRGIVSFFSDVQDLIARKGKNLTVFGNCKGNIIADEICDIGKSEGTEEAGIWDGRWVHNAVQAKFYYAAGDGWKPYRSKYEGADPGVPNPGAHSVVDEMKIGWKRPMAEARAFQSDFVIAEAGRNLLNGWLEKNNSVAMKAWDDICSYNRFFADNEAYYTDVRSIARIGVIAPPVIPSFEASVKRIQLYNALLEMNIMYDILLLPQLSPELLAHYDLIIVPDLPWLDQPQMSAVRAYKERGGKIMVMGSAQGVRDLATIELPAHLCHQTQEDEVRMEFTSELEKIMPDRIITLKNAENVLANMVKKNGSGQVIIHFVNYLHSRTNIRVGLNLKYLVDNIEAQNIRLYSPDNVPQELKSVTINDSKVEFTVPELKIYNMVVIN